MCARLEYVFDVSDVHKARRIGRDPYLWELREKHKEAVLAQLEKTYGETDRNSPFEQRLGNSVSMIEKERPFHLSLFAHSRHSKPPHNFIRLHKQTDM